MTSQQQPGEIPWVVGPAVAARALGVSRGTVLKWLEAGLMRWHVLPSGTRRILWSELVAFVERHPAWRDRLHAWGRPKGLPLDPPRAQTLTSGQAAAYLGVSRPQICRWCDSGLLRHYRLPLEDGSPGDRRILLCDAKAFAEEHEIPVNRLAAQRGADR